MKMSIRGSIFDGEDHVLWKIRMKKYMKTIGMEFWPLVEEGYNVPKDIPIEAEERKRFWEHAKSLNTLQVGLSKKVLAKVLTYKSANKLWDKLETIYVGDSKVNMEKIQKDE